MIADFTGSAPQAVGPVNAIYAVTASAIYNAFLHLTDPTIPRNEGCYRPFTIIAPPGTIVNCSFPAPVAGGNTETSPRITDMVFGALAARDPRPDRRRRAAAPRRRSSSAAPTRARASPTPTSTSRASAGAAARGSTATTWSSRSTATAATRRSRCSRRATRRSGSSRTGSSTDSGGPGEFRGGLGGERIFTVTVPEVTVSALLNRMKTEPWGVLGGGDGARRRALGAPRRAARVADVRRGVRDDVAVEVLRRHPARRRPGEDPDARRRRLRRPARSATATRVRRDVEEGFVSARGGAAPSTGSRRRALTMGEWKRERDLLPEGEPGRAATLCGHPIAVRYWGADVDGVELNVLLARARAALPRLLASPLRSEGGVG